MPKHFRGCVDTRECNIYVSTILRKGQLAGRIVLDAIAVIIIILRVILVIILNWRAHLTPQTHVTDLLLHLLIEPALENTMTLVYVHEKWHCRKNFTHTDSYRLFRPSDIHTRKVHLHQSSISELGYSRMLIDLMRQYRCPFRMIYCMPPRWSRIKVYKDRRHARRRQQQPVLQQLTSFRTAFTSVLRARARRRKISSPRAKTLVGIITYNWIFSKRSTAHQESKILYIPIVSLLLFFSVSKPAARGYSRDHWRFNGPAIERGKLKFMMINLE